MTDTSPRIVYVDARALQDPDFRFRGVGQHSSSLIEALRHRAWPAKRPRFVALTDVALEELAPQHRRLFDRVSTRPRRDPSYDQETGTEWFLSLSPMTHDPVWAAGLLKDRTLYRIALFYDLIQLQFPERYLATPTARMSFVIALAWLRVYDAYAAISRFSANDLLRRMAVPAAKVFVSGVAVRRELEPKPATTALPRRDRQWIVVAGGGDERKNPECALIAHAGSAILKKARLRLAVTGNYSEQMRSSLRALYAEHGGRPQDLAFQSLLTDAELHQLYREGAATVVPSRAEGFSIPIVESSAAGTPVLVSDIGAHPELVRDDRWRFGPDQPERLRVALENLATDDGLWTEAMESQAGLWLEYTLDRVGAAFLEGALARTPNSLPAPAITTGAKPRIAVLTPLPPAKSGVADYSAATLRPLKDVTEIHMFTPTPEAVWEPGWASLRPVSAAAFTAKPFDATISVIGNSDHHVAIFDHLLAYGGACIAHDARQIDFYNYKFGAVKSAEIASQELGRLVTVEEFAHWLKHQDKLPTLFMSEIARASEPLFVHSELTAKMLRSLYQADPVVLPFAQYAKIYREDLSTDARRQVRAQLGYSADELLIVTFGYVSDEKAPTELVWMTHFLAGWGIKPRLVFCGGSDPVTRGAVRSLAADLRVEDRIVMFEGNVGTTEYNQHLVAADIGVQLRTYGMGGLSGALNDCISAALPSVANRHLADAMAAPGFIRRVPDAPSAILIAEAVLEIVGQGSHRSRPLEEATDFRRRHTPAVYCRLLTGALGLDLAINEA